MERSETQYLIWHDDPAAQLSFKPRFGRVNIARAVSTPGLLAVRYPLVAVVSLFCLLVICLVSIPQVSFEEDITKSFSSDSSYSRDHQEFIASLGFVPRQVVVLAESSESFNVADFETLRNLAFEFELIDAVSSVYSVASVQFPKVDNPYPDAPLLPVDLDMSQIGERLSALRSAGIKAPLSADLRSALFVISLASDLDENVFSSAVDELRAAARKYGGTGLQYSFTGEDLIGPELVRALRDDLIFNNAIGCLLAFTVALILFGNFNLVLIAVLPAISAFLLTIATYTFSGFPITVVNAVIPTLILLLALADSVHLTLHFRDTDPGLPVRQRVESAVTLVGPACALTALTTAIAFAAIGVSGNQQLENLAIIGTVSILLAYIAVIVTFSLAALFLGGKGEKFQRPERLVISTHQSDWILNNARPIYAACIMVVCVSAVGLGNIFPWFNLDENLPTDSVVRTSNEKIARDFGGIYRIWSELDAAAENSLNTEAGWKRLVLLTSAIERAAPDYPVLSLATLSRWQGEPDKMLSSERLKDIPEELMAQLLSHDGKTARVITIVPEAMLDQDAFRIHNRIEETAILADAERNIGLPVVMRHESVSIVLQLSIGLGIACLISVGLVAAFYGWPMLAAALLVPNVLPLAVAAASLAVVQRGELTPTAMLALTVAFGIAIDDSIHLVNRFLVERKNGNDVDQSLKLSIRKTGKAMLVTTILISAGMLSTMFSSFETLQLFGGMLILIFVTAFFADILLLPCLLRALAAKS